MNAKTKIGLFIAAFCILALLPFAANVGAAKEAIELDYNTPEINALAEHKCVEDTEYMKSSHMQMLDTWRSDVVRYGNVEYVASDGQIYEKSLDNTCLNCHSNKEDFCDKCHTYEGVEPYCWDCHDPQGSRSEGGQ